MAARKRSSKNRNKAAKESLKANPPTPSPSTVQAAKTKEPNQIIYLTNLEKISLEAGVLASKLSFRGPRTASYQFINREDSTSKSSSENVKNHGVKCKTFKSSGSTQLEDVFSTQAVTDRILEELVF